MKRNAVTALLVAAVIVVIVVVAASLWNSSGGEQQVDREGSFTIISQGSELISMSGIMVIHDDDRNVTCWYCYDPVGNGLSCWPDHLLRLPEGQNMSNNYNCS